jgi:acyl carrier protein
LSREESVPNRSELKAKAQVIFRDVLGLPGLELKDEMVAKDVENWDSLNHITLVMSLEERFDIKFSTREVMGWKNVGEMLDTLMARVPASNV